MAEQERLSALLLKVLTDPALTKQRQAEGDPWVFTAPNQTWPNVRLYQNRAMMEKDLLPVLEDPNMPFPKIDPQLMGSFLESLRRGTGRTLGGYYSPQTRTIYSEYNPEFLQHELEHFFNPEERHPLFETLEEWKKRKQQKQSPPSFQFK